ncbi:MAG: very short patch repair endonuclease [Candidatus Altiarchaeota archaeon]|nr:very short patch repair endonuclease [Candidatus Altiarchaeota archaeon]
MTDVFSRDKRSEIMSKVRGVDTKPELIVRRILWGMGFNYRLNVKTILGKPDIVLPRRRKVIFVHGCFWHGHKGCRRSKRPSSNTQFWNAKIGSNILRDRKYRRALKQQGWKVLTVWECQTKAPERLKRMLSKFLIDNERTG